MSYKEQVSDIITKYHRPGIYLLKDVDNQIVYIGKSGDLSKRMLNHLLNVSMGDTFYSDVDTISLFYSDSELNATHLEVYLIDKYKPIKNRIAYAYKDWVKTLPSICKVEQSYIIEGASLVETSVKQYIVKLDDYRSTK